MSDLWNFSLFGRGDVSPTHSEFCRFVSGSQAKHQVSSPIIILFKKNFVCIGHRDNVLARCDSIFPLLRCQGVWNKTCTQLSLPQILFQNPKNYSLGDFQRFCFHSWCDSTVIFDQTNNSSNVYLSSSRFWTATSLVIFYQLPSVSKSRIALRNIWSVQTRLPITLLHQYWCFCSRFTGFETECYDNVCSFPPSMTHKENWLYKTSYNSYIVKDKQTKLSVWTYIVKDKQTKLSVWTYIVKDKQTKLSVWTDVGW